MNSDSSPQSSPDSTDVRPSITESPWFWAYVFATGAVVALLLGTSRYGDRQEQIERQYLARQRAGQVVARQDAVAEAPVEGEPIIPIWPLGLLMTLILSVAWMVFWFKRRPSFSADSAVVHDRGEHRVDAE